MFSYFCLVILKWFYIKRIEINVFFYYQSAWRRLSLRLTWPLKSFSFRRSLFAPGGASTRANSGSWTPVENSSTSFQWLKKLGKNLRLGKICRRPGTRLLFWSTIWRLWLLGIFHLTIIRLDLVCIFLCVWKFNNFNKTEI